jgi:hypothetical protein
VRSHSSDAGDAQADAQRPQSQGLGENGGAWYSEEVVQGDGGAACDRGGAEMQPLGLCASPPAAACAAGCRVGESPGLSGARVAAARKARAWGGVDAPVKHEAEPRAEDEGDDAVEALISLAAASAAAAPVPVGAAEDSDDPMLGEARSVMGAAAMAAPPPHLLPKFASGHSFTQRARGAPPRLDLAARCRALEAKLAAERAAREQLEARVRRCRARVPVPSQPASSRTSLSRSSPHSSHSSPLTPLLSLRSSHSSPLTPLLSLLSSHSSPQVSTLQRQAAATGGEVAAASAGGVLGAEDQEALILVANQLMDYALRLQRHCLT